MKWLEWVASVVFVIGMLWVQVVCFRVGYARPVRVRFAVALALFFGFGALFVGFIMREIRDGRSAHQT